MTTVPDSPTVHPIPQMATPKSKLVLGAVLVILAGLGVGFGLTRLPKPQPSPGSTSNPESSQASKFSKVIGSTDTKAFPDHATGTLEAGGLNGEGTHKLVRDGGPSQTVYLISSVVNLDDYVGKKAEIWGQTLDAKKAPWLMDVGRMVLSE